MGTHWQAADGFRQWYEKPLARIIEILQLQDHVECQRQLDMYLNKVMGLVPTSGACAVADSESLMQDNEDEHRIDAKLNTIVTSSGITYGRQLLQYREEIFQLFTNIICADQPTSPIDLKLFHSFLINPEPTLTLDERLQELPSHIVVPTHQKLSIDIMKVVGVNPDYYSQELVKVVINISPAHFESFQQTFKPGLKFVKDMTTFTEMEIPGVSAFINRNCRDMDWNQKVQICAIFSTHSGFITALEQKTDFDPKSFIELNMLRVTNNVNDDTMKDGGATDGDELKEGQNGELVCGNVTIINYAFLANYFYFLITESSRRDDTSILTHGVRLVGGWDVFFKVVPDSTMPIITSFGASKVFSELVKLNHPATIRLITKYPNNITSQLKYLTGVSPMLNQLMDKNCSTTQNEKLCEIAAELLQMAPISKRFIELTLEENVLIFKPKNHRTPPTSFSRAIYNYSPCLDILYQTVKDIPGLFDLIEFNLVDLLDNLALHASRSLYERRNILQSLPKTSFKLGGECNDYTNPVIYNRTALMAPTVGAFALGFNPAKSRLQLNTTPDPLIFALMGMGRLIPPELVREFLAHNLAELKKGGHNSANNTNHANNFRSNQPQATIPLSLNHTLSFKVPLVLDGYGRDPITSLLHVDQKPINHFKLKFPKTITPLQFATIFQCTMSAQELRYHQEDPSLLNVVIDNYIEAILLDAEELLHPMRHTEILFGVGQFFDSGHYPK